MSAANNGGLAFPCPESERHYREDGMTLRDYFAAKAMHQMLHGAVIPVGYDATEAFGVVAVRAYEMANAMLKARES